MKSLPILAGLLGLIWVATSCATVNSGPNPGRPVAAVQHWAADNGNGTYSNPLFYNEFEDPDVIRVGADYYLAGTTMHMNPAVEILHSRDLVNWELAGYCTNRLDLGPAYRLEGGNIYGNGIWAPCLRYHDGMFYIFCNVNRGGLLVFRSHSIQGPWERNELPNRHDLSVLFDDDGKVYLISGGSSPYLIEELAPDLRSFVTNAPKHQLVGQMGEGHHLYKINGHYVDVSAIPGGPVDQMVATADSIDGPWRVERMVAGESLGVTMGTPAKATANDRGLWLHQGGIVSTPGGAWWSIIMSDHGSAGRMVSLVPVTWSEGFPLIGLPGNLRKAPNTWLKPDTGWQQPPQPAYLPDDDFANGQLNPHWQWNHAPDDSRWSLAEKPGALRLHALRADNLWSARNSLCQRPPGPESVITVQLDGTGLQPGDHAGLGLLSTPYAGLEMVKSANATKLQFFGGAFDRRRGTTTEAPVLGPVNPAQPLWLRVHCDFDRDEASFSWSQDGRHFTALGPVMKTTFQLTTFQGVRVALFQYNDANPQGGYADFTHYQVEEPRAWGRERQIPVDRWITLQSGADGTYLANSPDHSLVNVPAAAKSPPGLQCHFRVQDLGLGRVALQAADGRFVSVNPDGVGLRDLAGAAPGVGESFQWINLLRGDTMLMSLTNHRYLSTQPHLPGRVTAEAAGPTPARLGGECFKWQALTEK
ncbi:MAG TPA: family 43 glycosylhydrolase [Verrucomicrobiae bacterium]